MRAQSWGGHPCPWLAGLLLLLLFYQCTLSLTTTLSDTARKYTGHLVVRTWPQHQRHLDVLTGIRQRNSDELDFWSWPATARQSVDIRASPDACDDLISALKDHSFQYEITVPDLQKAIDAERIQRSVSWAPVQFNLSTYHTYDEILTWLDHLAAGCGPECGVENIGTSSEGRALKALRIGEPQEGKPIIWIDAGIHAREWIAPSTALHIIHKLLEGRSSDLQVRFLLTRFTWYILPLANPDGYHYTWTKDRLWRKTRSVNPESPCIGADPNRNWDFHWGGPGTSDDPCSENYRGRFPFSEPETAAISSWLLARRADLAVYLTLHSYGQFWLTPWGYTLDVPQDYGHLLNVGHLVTHALRARTGTQYRVGASARMLYLAAGGSDDWAKGVAGVKYSYTVELRDTGRHGFILPSEFIDLTGQEMFHATKTLASEVLKERQRQQQQHRGQGRNRNQGQGQGQQEDSSQHGKRSQDGKGTEGGSDGGSEGGSETDHQAMLRRHGGRALTDMDMKHGQGEEIQDSDVKSYS